MHTSFEGAQGGFASAQSFQLCSKQREKDLVDQGAFSRTTDTCDGRQGMQRNADVNAFEVVFVRPLEFQPIGAQCTPRYRFILELAIEVGRSQGGVIGRQGFPSRRIAGKNHLATEASCARPHVDEVVCSTHNVFIVLHNYDGVAQVSELF